MGEKVRVLIVDDSVFYRNRIREQLERNSSIEIAGEAVNGREAVELSARLRPDLITMDVAMPEMDGISAVREIMRTKPTDILMISALTRDGARATLDALDAGAVDFLPKQGSLNGSGGNVFEPIADRVVEIAMRRRKQRLPGGQPPPSHGTAASPSAGGAIRRRTACGEKPRLVVIGASTGGPVAVQKVLSALPARFAYPLVVAVHMPAEFTATFAERLDAACAIGVSLAADGDMLRPAHALIAPGGKQTLIERRGGVLRVSIRPGGEQLYKPSVDILFGSAARALDGAVQAVVLTGMGADGAEGARMLKEHGASVWSQDQASSVVFGMPYAVAKAGHSDRVLSLQDIGPALAELA